MMRRTAILFLLALLGSGGAWAQAGPGSGGVTGTVKEAAGDGIPDTTVVLSNLGLAIRRVMTTSDDGLFNASYLVPSAGYRLKITRKGFQEWDSAEFALSVGQTQNFIVYLKHAGDAGEEEGGLPAPRVEEVKNGLTTLVTPTQIDTLPSPDLRLDPLVQIDPLAGIDHRSGRLMMVGQPASNLFLTEGIATTNTYNLSQLGVASQLTGESVQEFQVLAAIYPSAFGPAMGGVVNAVVRHGSNDLHGAGYDYFRNGSLAAANRFALGHKLLDHQNQVGGSLGGPIQPDRIFYYANVDYLDGQGEGLNRITSPILADAAGQTIAANCTATTLQCQAATKFLQSQMNVLVPLTDKWLTGLAKVDYRRSDRNNFSVTGNAMNANSPTAGNALSPALTPSSLAEVAPDGGLIGQHNTSEQFRVAKASWAAVPTHATLNELRLGMFQDRIFTPAATPSFYPGNVGISLAGVTVGNPQPNPSKLSELHYQVTDSITATSATHSFAAGGDLWQTRDTINAAAGGQYSYPSLTLFAKDYAGGLSTGKDYSQFTQEVGNGLRRVAVRQYTGYALDTWRPIRRLTILVGFRYEKPRYPEPPNPNTSYYETGSINSPNVDIAPRASVAYQWSNRTVFRVGYAWFYEPMPGRLMDGLYYIANALSLADVVESPQQTNAVVFPKVISSISTIPNGVTTLMWTPAKLRLPLVRDSSIAVERRLDPNTTFTLSVLDSRGYKQWSVADINLPIPTLSETYNIDNAAGQLVSTYTTNLWTTEDDSKFAHLWYVANGSSSWYNAGVAELRRRVAHGMSVQASYTYSHNTIQGGGPLLYGVLPLDYANGSLAQDKGNAPNDQRHHGVLNWTWQPEHRWLKGWTFSGIGMAGTGQPETPLVLVQGQPFSGTTNAMLYPTSLTGWGGWSRVPFEQIGSLSTRLQYNLNARLSRSFQFYDRVKAVLMFEGFNVLNSQFNTAVNTYAYTCTPTAPPNGAVNGPTTGVLKPLGGLGDGIASSAARMLQIALRVTF